MDPRARRLSELARQYHNYREAGLPHSSDFDADAVQLLPLWRLAGYTPRCGPHPSADWMLPAFFTSRGIPIEYAFFKQVPYAVQPV